MKESLAATVPPDIVSNFHNSDTYRRWFFEGVRLDEFDQILSNSVGEEWVDLGCGLNPWYGVSLQARVQRLISGPSLVGVDPRAPFNDFSGMDWVSEDLIKISREIGKLKPDSEKFGEWVAARGDSMPFDRESKDLVMSHMAFPHHFDDLATAKEVHRVLKPKAQARLSAKVLDSEIEQVSEISDACIIEGVISKNFSPEASMFVMENFSVSFFKPKGVRDPFGTIVLTKE